MAQAGASGLDKHCAYLIEQINGQKHHHQRKWVASGSNDGRQDQQRHYGMTAVSAEEAAVQHAHIAKEPGKQRQLKHYL